MSESEIIVEHQPSEERLQSLGVRGWPVWTKEPSEFPWSYDQTEVCYLLEGQVIVTPERGNPVEFGRGDLVTFPKGLSCTWKILQAVRKHYRFS
ncbi:cupin domain-containing protein [Candidatus Methylocalor cossyra]|uniref:Cupin_3 domain-containing protein n=1 Tax=Candidatus Methylocalor cossyra TaxID=3108543 RepID=A0ABM9NF59_9GAMM